MGFKNYIKNLEDEKTMVFTFGRFNPFTKGHRMLWDAVLKESKKQRADGKIYTSWSQNSKKNPLTPGDKVMYIKKALPKGLTVSEDQSLRNTQQIAKDLIAKGYTKLVLVVGADRLSDFDAMKKQVKEFSDGETTLEVVSFSGKSRIGDYSGTKMRQMARDGDFEGFYNDLPSGLNKKEAQQMFEKVQAGLI